MSGGQLETEDEAILAARYPLMPESIRKAFRLYVEERREAGSFVMACLRNDLVEAVCRADEASLAGIRHAVLFLYNEVPSPCWGSPEKVAAWLAEGKDAGPDGH